jgi:hypothetical protein
VADSTVPGACQACGRMLPPQEGKGRRRLYCDARCRSAARRERVRQEQAVKKKLTVNRRNEYLDMTGSKSSPDDLVAARALDAARHLADELSQPLGAVAAARELSAAADAALQAAVDRARAAGQSWRDIGEVLGTTRQAAFQRFGHPIDPRTGGPMSREIPADAADRALAIFDWHDQGRWQEILDELDDAMRSRHDPARLSRGWAALAGQAVPPPGGRRHRGRCPAALRGGRRQGDRTVRR